MDLVMAVSNENSRVRLLDMIVSLQPVITVTSSIVIIDTDVVNALHAFIFLYILVSSFLSLFLVDCVGYFPKDFKVIRNLTEILCIRAGACIMFIRNTKLSLSTFDH